MSTSQLLVPRSDHVPEARFFDFNIHHDPALLRYPHTRVLELIETAPLFFWTPRNGGH